MHATRLSRGHLIRYLPGDGDGTAAGEPQAAAARPCEDDRGASREAPLCVHADGEFVCVPEDGVREIAVEVVPRRLRVEVYPPALYGGRNANEKSPPAAGGL